ncbi:MAG TPA: tetratricopeptide repeat protein [Puia sp.]|jgi:tetratricopeptide (TPR) repeat protein|nr:tetratricopeptide repeat protein [Puia sp.]
MDNLDYIDQYFERQPSPQEAARFEKRVQEDPVFADHVAYYLSTRIALKEMQAGEKEKEFRELYSQMGGPAKVRPMNNRIWLSALAAASLIAAIVLCWSLFSRSGRTAHLAEKYISQNLTLLSVKMGRDDSIQTGLVYYNDRKYPEALLQFENILRTDSTNVTALLNAGIVSLKMGNYDNALSFFERLAARTDPHLSPALFYQALTLMKRNHPGDTALAKQFLRQIVQQNGNKKEDALQLLREM